MSQFYESNVTLNEEEERDLKYYNYFFIISVVVQVVLF